MDTRNELPKYFKSLGFKVGAEIGVYRGWFTKRLLDAGLKVYGIDPWGHYEGHSKRQQHYDEAKKTLKQYIDSGQCELIRKASMDAIKDFVDGSLDFVYIDADHRFKYIAEDLYHWTWKVRKGGIVSGHDYNYNGVEDVNQTGPVVDAYVKSFKINGLRIIGEKDKASSWLWIKE